MYDFILTMLDAGFWISSIMVMSFVGILVLVIAEDLWRETSTKDDDDANT